MGGSRPRFRPEGGAAGYPFSLRLCHESEATLRGTVHAGSLGSPSERRGSARTPNENVYGGGSLDKLDGEASLRGLRGCWKSDDIGNMGVCCHNRPNLGSSLALPGFSRVVGLTVVNRRRCARKIRGRRLSKRVYTRVSHSGRLKEI